MRADGVVVGPVVLGVHDEVEDVVDLFEEELLVFQRSEATFAGAVLPGSPDPGADVTQLGVGGDERLETQGPEGSAAAGDDGEQRLDAAVGVAGGEVGLRSAGQALGLGESSIAVIASCWFAVGAVCQPSSYVDQ